MKNTEQEILSYTRSPLRYPGGKTRAIKHILPLIPSDVKTLCSPFFGGGSIELACASRGIKVKGYDVFSPLVNFWQCLIQDPVRLSRLVQNYFPMTKEKFRSLQLSYDSIEDSFHKASAFFVLNRSSFSGSTLSGGFSAKTHRFTESSIQKLAFFKGDNLTVECLDFKNALELNKGEFCYLDPPYLIESNLYGVNGSTHKNFDHDGLADILRNRDSWILSYNDCPQIRDLYKGFRMTNPAWSYGMANGRKSNELLILNI